MYNKNVSYKTKKGNLLTVTQLINDLDSHMFVNIMKNCKNRKAFISVSNSL